ncbi:MAG: putative solute-binding protein [Methylotenera sp.]
MTMMRQFFLFSLCLSLFSLNLHASDAPHIGLDQQPKDLVPILACVFDPIGKAGPVGQIMKEAKIHAYNWGVDLDYVVYSDERIAIDEFKLGRCDAVNMLGFRAREFNTFTGSLGAIGAIPSYEHLGIIIKTISSPKASKLMRIGEYEIFGIGPAGAIFMFTRDRTILQPKDFAGLRMAVLDGIPESEYLSEKYGITPVNSTIFNSILKFNNGTVDLTAAPAIVYEPFEMHKGLEPNGGIYKEPFLYITMQVVARWEKFPEGFAQKARSKAVEEYPRFVKFLTDPEATIPEHYWIDIPKHLYDFWVEDFRESRLELGKRGIYDQRTLKLMRKVRCKVDSQLAECSANNRE